MNCKLQKAKGSVYICVRCGRTLKIEGAKPSDAMFSGMVCGLEQTAEEREPAIARAQTLGAMKVDKGDGKLTGPGTEFRKMAEEAGFGQNGCDCKSTEIRMNRLGVDGCRREFDSLCDEVLANAKNRGIDLSFIVCDLLREAIRRAEQSDGSPQSPADQAS